MIDHVGAFVPTAADHAPRTLMGLTAAGFEVPPPPGPPQMIANSLNMVDLKSDDPIVRATCRLVWRFPTPVNNQMQISHGDTYARPRRRVSGYFSESHLATTGPGTARVPHPGVPPMFSSYFVLISRFGGILLISLVSRVWNFPLRPLSFRPSP